ncbi:unnamed protein product [Amoebophrya sp. A25]|nr:unnamed protein product [Amoebophrya sp. A25]|eukprot:GSA25T00019704001.1
MGQRFSRCRCRRRSDDSGSAASTACSEEGHEDTEEERTSLPKTHEDADEPDHRDTEVGSSDAKNSNILGPQDVRTAAAIPEEAVLSERTLAEAEASTDVPHVLILGEQAAHAESPALPLNTGVDDEEDDVGTAEADDKSSPQEVENEQGCEQHHHVAPSTSTSASSPRAVSSTSVSSGPSTTDGTRVVPMPPPSSLQPQVSREDCAAARGPPGGWKMRDKVRLVNLKKREELNQKLGLLILLPDSSSGAEQQRFGVMLLDDTGRQLSVLADNLLWVCRADDDGGAPTAAGHAGGRPKRGFLLSRGESERGTSTGSSSGAGRGASFNEEKVVEALCKQGGTHFLRREFRQACDVFQQALDLAESDSKLQGRAARLLGVAKDKNRCPQEDVQKCFQKAMQVAYKHSDFECVFDTLTAMGSAAMGQGDQDAAEVYYNQAVELSKRGLQGLGWHHQAQALANHGIALASAAEDDEGGDNVAAPSSSSVRHGSSGGGGPGASAGSSASATGRYAAARLKFEEAARVWERQGFVREGARFGEADSAEIARVTRDPALCSSFATLLTNYANVVEKGEGGENSSKSSRRLYETALTFARIAGNQRLEHVISINLANLWPETEDKRQERQERQSSASDELQAAEKRSERGHAESAGSRSTTASTRSSDGEEEHASGGSTTTDSRQERGPLSDATLRAVVLGDHADRRIESVEKNEECAICLEPLVSGVSREEAKAEEAGSTTSDTAISSEETTNRTEDTNRTDETTKEESKTLPRALLHLDCGHRFHRDCIQRLMTSGRDAPFSCPLCRNRCGFMC